MLLQARVTLQSGCAGQADKVGRPGRIDGELPEAAAVLKCPARRSVLILRGRPGHPPLPARQSPPVVELTFARLHRFKGPRTRYEMRADSHPILLHLACSIICLRRPRASF
ncbi:hypothetical protein GCM10010495_80790 [Kitasatospora herbaricolor]|nr:hypothetical protein GCM10010495_80790 [Kitasatospora herbaricolor]